MTHDDQAGPPSSQEIRAWLQREAELGLVAVPRVAAEAAIASAVPTPATAPARSEALVAGRMAPGTAFQPQPGRALGAGAEPRGSGAPDPLVEPAVAGAATLEDLRGVLGDCERCKLCRGRTHIVFGTGNPRARLMFVGEGPGEEEDLRGEPFVGKAGALLDAILSGGMGLRRADVYIANVIKCRPPGNRNPEPDEIVACEPFLRRQVELVQPEVIVSLGNFATQALLRDRTPISRRRGHWHEVGGIPLMPTFHPAYLLRNPSDKRLVWEDIQLVMARLGIPLPGKGGAR